MQTGALQLVQGGSQVIDLYGDVAEATPDVDGAVGRPVDQLDAESLLWEI